MGKEISIGKTSSAVYSNVNGHKTSHGEVKEQLTKNGKVFAKLSEKTEISQDDNGEPKSKSKVEVEIPSKGIHKTILKEGENVEVIDGQDFSNNGQRRSDNSIGNGIDKLNSYAGLEYTPLDMAEYIFWTGDEKGVIMAIEEFLEEGLMSREEAINFLRSIKTDLDYMQEHYHGLQKTENRINGNGRTYVQDRLSDLEKPFDYDSIQDVDKMNDVYDGMNKYEIPMDKSDPYDRAAKVEISRYENPLRNLPESLNDRKKRVKEEMKSANGVTLTEEDFEELLERLRVADFLYSEYSLEEVIYQLAKVVFSQSLARGGADAQFALQKFTTFLEKEARHGQISRNLERKIIDLLIAALSDTLTENPQLLSVVRESLNDVEEPTLTNSLLKHQLHGNEASTGSRSLKLPVNTSTNLQGKASNAKN